MLDGPVMNEVVAKLDQAMAVYEREQRRMKPFPLSLEDGATRWAGPPRFAGQTAQCR